MEIDLSVVIVNYNGVSYLKECFNSIYNKLDTLHVEVIVVDNASSDNSVDYIESNYADVKLIKSAENLGFGKANNLGVQNAKGKTILLLNNDTILLDKLEPALALLYSSEAVGVVSIKMLGGQKNYITSVGRFPKPFRLLKLSFLNEVRKEFITGEFDLNKSYVVDWTTGAFMLIRKSDYIKVGGFDEDYFMYVEDVDLCKKITNLGKKCFFAPGMAYVHFVGFNNTRENLLIRGYEIYISKHFSGANKVVGSLMLGINKLVKILKKKY